MSHDLDFLRELYSVRSIAKELTLKQKNNVVKPDKYCTEMLQYNWVQQEFQFA